MSPSGGEGCQRRTNRRHRLQGVPHWFGALWSDEFDQDGPVSQDKWNVETIPPNNGSWWNGELQFYTDKEDNIRVEEGLLKITAKYESFEGKNYTSARINTQDKFEFTYGRVEMRAKHSFAPFSKLNFFVEKLNFFFEKLI